MTLQTCLAGLRCLWRKSNFREPVFERGDAPLDLLALANRRPRFAKGVADVFYPMGSDWISDDESLFRRTDVCLRRFDGHNGKFDRMWFRAERTLVDNSPLALVRWVAARAGAWYSVKYGGLMASFTNT